LKVVILPHSSWLIPSKLTSKKPVYIVIAAPREPQRPSMTSTPGILQIRILRKPQRLIKHTYKYA